MKLLSIVLYSFLSFSAYGQLLNDDQNQLELKCDTLNGVIVDDYICPKNLKIRKNPVCVIQTRHSEFFFNGCTGVSWSFYGGVFFEACFKHDLCYHHEPVTGGLSRRQCDLEFERNMKALCDHQDLGTDCHDAATLFYGSVRMFGGGSYHCANELAPYREYF